MIDEVPTEAMDTETPTASHPSPFTDTEHATATEPDREPADEAAAEPGADPAPTEPVAPVPLQLYFLRHADAGDPMTWQGDDADRPLSKKGRRQSKALMRLLDELHLRVDAVLTSPKLRAADTAKIVAKAVGRKAHADDRLSVDFGEDTLAALVAEWGPDVQRVILVGHDPDFSHLVSWLAGTSITMRKGALARLDLADRSVGAGHGSLRWLLPPDAVAD